VPIHDQSYRRYGGKRDVVGRAWQVIARNGIVTMLRKRLFLGLLLAAWVPFVVQAIIIYFSTNFAQVAPILQVNAERFRTFLQWQQNLPVFIITVWVGAGLIANDKRANALQIYLSKPLSRFEYITGKMVILGVFLLGVTLLPALLLLVLQVSFSGSFTFLRQNLYLFPAITLLSFLQVLLSAFLILALSSMSKSSRYVAILYAAVVFFSDAVYGIVYAITGNSGLSWISFGANLRQLGNVIFRLDTPYSTHPAVSLLAVLVLIGVSAWVLERQVRGVEVVS
jgi:ABC-2 type transport system permease protein